MYHIQIWIENNSIQQFLLFSQLNPKCISQLLRFQEVKNKTRTNIQMDAASRNRNSSNSTLQKKKSKLKRQTKPSIFQYCRQHPPQKTWFRKLCQLQQFPSHRAPSETRSDMCFLSPPRESVVWQRNSSCKMRSFYYVMLLLWVFVCVCGTRNGLSGLVSRWNLK